MRILVAPDKFKGSLTAEGAAAAMADGARDTYPDAGIDICPLADGGDGSGEILARAMRGERRTARVQDPLDRLHAAEWWLSPNGVAIVELAAASGLRLLREDERDPLRASTFGTGMLLAEAAACGAREILLCVGGSATVDGGAGCLQAMGWRARGATGEIGTPLGGGGLASVVALTPPQRPFPAAITILCDVTNPLLGANGAAATFGPQKGASASEVIELERNLTHWARVLRDVCGRDVSEMSSGGAAGGIVAGLVACAGARATPGFDHIAQLVDLEARIGRCDLCLTGEGRLDLQSAAGKVVGGVARLAAIARKRAVAFVGSAAATNAAELRRLCDTIGLSDAVVCTPAGVAADEAMRDAALHLRAAVASYLRTRE